MRYLLTVFVLLLHPHLAIGKTKPLQEVLGFQSYQGQDSLYYPKYHKAYNLVHELRNNGVPVNDKILDCRIAQGLTGFAFQNAVVFEKTGYDYLTILSRETMIQLQCDLSVVE